MNATQGIPEGEDSVTIDFYNTLVVTLSKKVNVLKNEVVELLVRVESLERKLQETENGQEWQRHLADVAEKEGREP